MGNVENPRRRDEELYARTQAWLHQRGLFEGQPPVIDYAASVAA
jgi:hypothetical protein